MIKKPSEPFLKILGAVWGDRTGRRCTESDSQVVKLTPSDPEAHYNLGLTLKMLGRMSQAEMSLRKAIEFNSFSMKLSTT